MHPMTAPRLILAHWHLDRLWRNGIISFLTYRRRNMLLGGML